MAYRDLNSSMIAKVQITHLRVDCHLWLLRKTILTGQARVSPTPVCSMSRFLCTVSTYFRLSITANAVTSAGHSYCTLLLPPHMPIFLHHSVSCRPSDIEHICPTVRPCLGNTDRGGRKNRRWDSGWKSHRIVQPTHCYLTHSRPTMFYSKRSMLFCNLLSGSQTSSLCKITTRNWAAVATSQFNKWHYNQFYSAGNVNNVVVTWFQEVSETHITHILILVS